MDVFWNKCLSNKDIFSNNLHWFFDYDLRVHNERFIKYPTNHSTWFSPINISSGMPTRLVSAADPLRMALNIIGKEIFLIIINNFLQSGYLNLSWIATIGSYLAIFFRQLIRGTFSSHVNISKPFQFSYNFCMSDNDILT